jgi:hypothetical protein
MASSRFVDSHEDRTEQDRAQKAEHGRPGPAERDLENRQALCGDHNHAVAQ